MFRNTITTITILAGCLLLASCRQGANPKGSGNGAERARVVVTRPERRNLSLEIARPGYVKAFEKTPLYAKLEGYVGKTRTVKNGSGKDVPGELADIGEPVKEGEILAEILVPELVEELNQDKALQIQAEAGVEQAAKSLLVAERKEESVLAQVAESKAGLIKTQGDYERWKAEYHRVNELAQGGSVTKQLVDEKKQQFKASEAARSEAVAKVDSVIASHAESTAKVAKAKADAVAAKAAVEVAKAKVDRVKALLDYSKIRAPFDGIITERNVDTGHYVRPPQANTKPLFVVARTDTVRVFVDVPETEASYITAGNRAVIEVQALKNRIFEGTVTRSAGALDAVARTLKTEIDLPNKDRQLLPNMYVMATLTLKERKQALTVPVTAIVQQSNKTYCFCVGGDNKLVRKEVGIGLRTPQYVEILSGLDGNDQVVRENAAGLHEGQVVEVASEERS